MSTNYQKFYDKDYQKLLEKYDKKSEDYKQLKYEYQLLDKRMNYLAASHEVSSMPLIKQS